MSRQTIYHPLVAAALAVWCAGTAASADEPTLTPGTQIRAAEIERIRHYLPEAIHPFTIDGFSDLDMRIVATEDYRPHPKYIEATAKYACQATLDEHGQLRNYTAGQPFPYSDWATAVTNHACDLRPDDPHFALKMAWNVNYRWNGGGIKMHFGQSFWRAANDNTWKIAQGSYQRTYFSGRADLLPASPELVAGTELEWAEFSEMHAPFDIRGTMFMVLRYRDSVARGDDAWAYVPTLRRVRRISTEQKADSLQGSEFTLEDVLLFSGYVWDQEWKVHGEHRYIAAMDTRRDCYPLNSPDWDRGNDGVVGDDGHFHHCAYGPYKALPFVDEDWQVRDVVTLEQIPKRANHPYSRRLLWYDKQSLAPLFALSYDPEQKPLRLTWYVGDWSETGGDVNRRGMRVVLISAGGVVNLQNDVSNLSQSFASEANRLDARAAKRLYDITRLKTRVK